MFFRTKKPHQFPFEERLEILKQAGFTIEKQNSGARVSKLGCAAILTDGGIDHPEVGKAGVVVGNEIGELLNRGYQMFFKTPSGKTVPALATHLKALHDFQEDLKEGLGMTSLYNQSLGTTSDMHMYDRVKGRDRGVPKRPWE
jgi:hypothetical protein